MSYTQIASNLIGIPEMLDRDIATVTTSDSLNNLFILDKQHDNILAHIHKSFVISSEHEQDLPTGIELLSFTAIDHPKYSKFLGERNGIVAPDDDGKLREFRIFRVDKYRNADGVRLVDVYANASYLDLINAKVIQPFKSNLETSEWHVNKALAGTEIRAGNIDYRGAKRIEFRDATNPYEYLKRIAKEFELELNFYAVADGTTITRYVDLVDRIGDNRGRIVEFGRDLKSIRRIEDTQNVVTALFGYGPENEDGERISVFVEDKDALERWGRNGQHIVDVYYPQSDRLDMTEDELRQYTKTELNKRINETVTYEGEIVDLEHMPGMENKKIRFGDTIGVKDVYFNPPLYLEARIFNQRRDVFNRTPKEFKLGDYREFTEDEVHEYWNQIRDEINRRMDRLAIVTITSSAGNIFKNAEGSTHLVAHTFVQGKERDEDGSFYNYQWIRFDKDGNKDPTFYEEGKELVVTADDIDVKATYRVDVSIDSSVINSAEITISNVFDGEQGPPGEAGEKGDKGADGRSVDDITTQYYKSTSDTEQIGGSWLDDRPDYDKGYFLWTRSKISYSNPSGTDYTTPILDDSWQAIDIADDAVLTADGKNSVFRQATEPSVIGRKIDDIWFNEAEGNRMYTFDGVSWQASEWGEQAIAAQSITALNIKSLAGLNVNDQFMVDENGNVTFGGEMIGGRIIGSEFRTSFDGYGVMVINPEGIKMGEAFDYNAKGLILDFNSLEFGRFYDDDFIRTAKYSENIIEAVDELVVKSPKIRFDGGYVIEFAGGPSIDTTDGRARLRANNASYAVVDPDGRFSTWGPGALRTFSVNASGTVTTASDNRDYYALHLQPNGNLRIFNSNVNDYVFELDEQGQAVFGYGQSVYINNLLTFFIRENGIPTFPQMWDTAVSTNAANVRVGTNGAIVRTTSSSAHKIAPQKIGVDYYKILDVEIVDWYDKNNAENYAELLTKKSKGADIKDDLQSIEKIRRIPGVIAEQVEEVGLEQFVEYDNDGNVVGVMESRLTLLLIPIVKDILERLDRIEIR